MVARHALTTAGCSHCRLAVLKLFTSPSNALPVVRPGFLQYRPRSIAPAPIRTFSSQPVLSEASNSKGSAEEGLEENDAPVTQGQDDGAKDSSSAFVPWYLQVEPPRHVASIEPPPLPEVPSGSPEIIGSLVEYAAEELGLDELSILDLRELDPPAALGPDLFMLFGTARSERHLNVSAGRLLRWLRAKHRVYAHADGLLGPNERKTKVRRKAKRAKLLGGVEDTDDGIKTGWICVNLGTIGRGREESAVVAEDGRAAGFGVARSGSTIVLQIMTESRRAEMGLEALWKKSLGQPVDDTAKTETENLDNLHPLERAILSNSRPSVTSRNGHFNDTSRRTPYEQTRSYSMPSIGSTRPIGIAKTPNSNPPFDIPSKEGLGHVLTFNARQKLHVVELLRDRLDELSLSARKAPNGLKPTPFFRLSKLACQNLPLHQTWDFRLDVLTRAYESSSLIKQAELLDGVRRLIDEMHIYGIEATRQQYLQLLTCIYSSSTEGLREQSQLALQLLKTVQQRGQPVIANDIIVTIIEAAARFPERFESKENLGLIRRLEDLLLQADLPGMDEPLVMRLMEAYYRLRNWEGFWNAWRIPPRYLRPRSAVMYIHMYKLAAATRSSAFCTLTLRRCFQEMLTEEPPVPPTGVVREALMSCVRVADPHAEENAQSVDTTGHSRRGKGEFVKLVRNIQLLAR
ncbi:hypothetical protein F4819DRAFT_480012 [Hypoxylon fuscum]|nr:hypothetical protein F4819DRAFT_480012 [Hypoxylon fuscum]